LRRANPIVLDLIALQDDGRPTASEPFDAFADELERLGHKPFRLWWNELVSELRHHGFRKWRRRP
jgi:hypothetical protein